MATIIGGLHQLAYLRLSATQSPISCSTIRYGNLSSTAIAPIRNG